MPLHSRLEGFVFGVLAGTTLYFLGSLLIAFCWPSYTPLILAAVVSGGLGFFYPNVATSLARLITFFLP